jgi:hypothetical protein
MQARKICASFADDAAFKGIFGRDPLAQTTFAFIASSDIHFFLGSVVQFGVA